MNHALSSVIAELILRFFRLERDNSLISFCRNTKQRDSSRDLHTRFASKNTRDPRFSSGAFTLN